MHGWVGKPHLFSHYPHFQLFLIVLKKKKDYISVSTCRHLSATSKKLRIRDDGRCREGSNLESWKKVSNPLLYTGFCICFFFVKLNLLKIRSSQLLRTHSHPPTLSLSLSPLIQAYRLMPVDKAMRRARKRWERNEKTRNKTGRGGYN